MTKERILAVVCIALVILGFIAVITFLIIGNSKWTGISSIFLIAVSLYRIFRKPKLI